MSTEIRFARGPYSYLAGINLDEGEPFEAGIAVPNNTYFEMLWGGGHDGANKLLGGGFQLTTGQPQFAAPIGAALLDPSTCTLWFSTAYAASGSGTGTGTGTGSGYGQWCSISENNGVQEIDTTAPILGGPITSGQTGTISHAVSGVTPGSYTSANLTVDQWGHVTAAANGSGGGSGLFASVKQLTTGANTLTSADNGKLCVANYGSSSTGSVALPTPTSTPWCVGFTCVGSPASLSTASLQITLSNPAQELDSVANGTLSLYANQGVLLAWDGTNWWTDRGAPNLYAHLNLPNTFTDGNQTVQTGNDANVAMVLRGNSATQSADLLQLQDYLNNVKFSIAGDPTYVKLTWPAQSIQMFGYAGKMQYGSTSAGYGQVVMDCSSIYAFMNLYSAGNDYYCGFTLCDISGTAMMIFEAGYGHCDYTSRKNYYQQFVTTDSSGTTHQAIYLDPTGQVAINGQMFVQKNATYTLAANDTIVECDASSAAFPLNLPAANAVVAGKEYKLVKIDSSANAVTVTAAGSDKINGASTYTLSAQWKYVVLYSDGYANWRIIGSN